MTKFTSDDGETTDCRVCGRDVTLSVGICSSPVCAAALIEKLEGEVETANYYYGIKDAAVQSMHTRIDELEKELELTKAISNGFSSALLPLEARIHEAQEIYAGMEGFKPETAPEGYCLRIIEQMYAALMESEDE